MFAATGGALFQSEASLRMRVLVDAQRNDGTVNGGASGPGDGGSRDGGCRTEPRALMLSLALAIVWIFGADARPVAAEFDSHQVSSFVTEAFNADRVPGGAVAVVREGNVVFLKGFGHDADGRPVTEETGFRLGSMSKAFAALAVMRKVEQGTLSLDQTVVSVIPDFRLADEKVSVAITLRQLLAHSSGIPERAPRASSDASLKDHVAALVEAVPAGRPGQRHIYASPNYLVAARLVEVASGESFEDVLQGDVLAPLGMNQTYVSETQDTRGLLSGGHQYWFGFPVPSQLPEDRGRLATASLISSATDMARFLRFQLSDGTFEGRHILSPAGMSEMHRGTIEGDGFRYAMGWRDTTIGSTRAIEHGGILPDYRGKMIVLPEFGAAVVVLTNASTGAPLPAQPTSHRVAESIAEYLAGGELKHPTLGFGVVSLAVAAGLGLILLATAAELLRTALGKKRQFRAGLRNLLDVVVVGGLAVALPMVLGLDWPSIFMTMPDFALWMVAVAALSIATVVARTVFRH